MTKDDELLPCPFCGGEASCFEDSGHSTAWEIGCFNGQCRAEPHVWEKTKTEAVVAWNTRCTPTPPEVRALEEALKRSKRLRDQYRAALDAERDHSNPASAALAAGEARDGIGKAFDDDAEEQRAKLRWSDVEDDDAP